jgi:hypothetical protein
MLNVNVDGRPERLKPPASLPKPERQLFLNIVNSLPPEHFRPSDLVLMTRYVEASALAERAAAQLRLEPVQENGKPSGWLAIADKMGRSLVSLSQRLRLSPQSRLDAKSAAREPQTFRAPWLDYGDNRDEGDENATQV